MKSWKVLQNLSESRKVCQKVEARCFLSLLVADRDIDRYNETIKELEKKNLLRVYVMIYYRGRKSFPMFLQKCKIIKYFLRLF
jgi:hypothetical protein